MIHSMPRSWRSAALAMVQPSFAPPPGFRPGPHVGEEHLVEVDVVGVGQFGQRATAMPGESMSMMSTLMPLCLGCVGVGADVAEALGRVHGVSWSTPSGRSPRRRPRGHGPGGEVARSRRHRARTCPRTTGVPADGGPAPAPSGRRAELQQRGGPDGVGPGSGRNGASPTGHLLEVDERSGRRGVAAAELGRVARDHPAVVEQRRCHSRAQPGRWAEERRDSVLADGVREVGVDPLLNWRRNAASDSSGASRMPHYDTGVMSGRCRARLVLVVRAQLPAAAPASSVPRRRADPGLEPRRAGREGLDGRARCRRPARSTGWTRRPRPTWRPPRPPAGRGARCPADWRRITVHTMRISSWVFRSGHASESIDGQPGVLGQQTPGAHSCRYARREGPEVVDGTLGAPVAHRRTASFISSSRPAPYRWPQRHDPGSGSWGWPRSRSAMTLRWILPVPPAMVRQRVAKNPCDQRAALASSVAPSAP